jgi:hypothetical protein
MAKEIAFNPFVLSLKMTEFEIQEQDGAPLIGFQEFFINFQTVSLLHRAYVFKEIRFALPFVSIKVAKDGHVNLTDLLPPEEAAASSLPPEDSHSPKGLPAIQIEHFEIAQGIVEFQDASKPQAVSIDVVPINLMLNNFYTKQGGDNRYAFTAELDKDEILSNPSRRRGRFPSAASRSRRSFNMSRINFTSTFPPGPSGRLAATASLQAHRSTSKCRTPCFTSPTSASSNEAILFPSSRYTHCSWMASMLISGSGGSRLKALL